MTFLYDMSFPKVDMKYLQDCTQIVQFTYHEDLQRSVKYALLCYNEFIILYTGEAMYNLFPLNKSNSLMQLFHLLRIEYSSIDITSNILLNHTISAIMQMEILIIPIMTMDVYTSKYTLQCILSGLPMPLLQVAKDQVKCILQHAHISVASAEKILRD